MTQEAIFTKLGILNATDEMKQEVLRGIIEKVDRQFAQIVDDLLDDNQKAELERVSEQSTNPGDVVRWLQQTMPKAAELYSALLEDEVDTLSEKLAA